ncbi:hypothetical protein Ahy_B08g090751 [Arachis hypogaea]|uniref:MULE transposase domain-containing protein n=1 Tax=Arachis hypogaea TaxID=3818 RepID=A0A444Y0J7_ARAHY|nr:hypothetical protein Ahy_B08g090751 [Arachis hypogaea]
MECNSMELLCHLPSSVTDDNLMHATDNHLNPCDLVGELANKDMQVSDLIEVGSDETNLGHENGCRGSHVKSPTWKNTISVVGCKARVYAKFDREKQDWVFFKVELRHSHPCSTEKVVHYHEYRELTMHAKHGLPFASFVGVNHHGKSTLLDCALLGNDETPSYGWVFSQWLKCIGTAPQGIINDQCKSMYGVIRKEYTSNMFRDVQVKFVKKADCRVSVVAEEGDSVCVKVEEEKLVNDTPLCVAYDVHFDRATYENVKRKQTYVKSIHGVSRSDESHKSFKELSAHFFNVAQEFVNDDEKTAMMHAALEETKAKQNDYRAKKRLKSIADTHASIGTQSSMGWV